jgi:hypothetical protein
LVHLSKLVVWAAFVVVDVAAVEAAAEAVASFMVSSPAFLFRNVNPVLSRTSLRWTDRE